MKSISKFIFMEKNWYIRATVRQLLSFLIKCIDCNFLFFLLIFTSSVAKCLKNVFYKHTSMCAPLLIIFQLLHKCDWLCRLVYVRFFCFFGLVLFLEQKIPLRWFKFWCGSISCGILWDVHHLFWLRFSKGSLLCLETSWGFLRWYFSRKWNWKVMAAFDYSCNWFCVCLTLS